ncbi:MAG TPA: DUF547 domain-containing protein [Flavisolibacter sp.]|nr:DUF547 domain-containing protein [Flavisolibacter sp.]
MLWIIGLCLVQFQSIGQGVPAKGDAFQTLPIRKALNTTVPLTSSAGFDNKLTIVDFFGTWCVPCLRALPHLTKLQESFRKELAVVLVSAETETQLAKFINARNNFPFPVIVDEDNTWNNSFQPPSLPFTVVVKNKRVLAITDAASITEDAVKQWLNQPGETTPPVTLPGKTDGKSPKMNTNQRSKNNLVALSQEYIYAAKTGGTLGSLTQDLGTTSFDGLKTRMPSDNEKKAFWINLYNGYTQAALKENAGQYKARNAFFKQKSIQVAGDLLSLDDIEHGILRRSKIKWSLGHLNKLFPSKKEKSLRVDALDYRIHFALNCGAKSCPPIAFYNDDTLDAQLDLATKAFLTSEAEYDTAANVIRLPKLMSWFRADFGGKKGMIKILQQHGIIAKGAKPKVEFKDYDWTLTLNNYTTQNP